MIRQSGEATKGKIMVRVDTDKYSVLIRSDYLYALGKLSSSRQERHKLIEEAIEGFLHDYSYEERLKEIEKEGPRVEMSRWSTQRRPEYHMYLEIIRVRDELVTELDLANRFYPGGSNAPGYDLIAVLNAAIRLFLERNNSEYLEEYRRAVTQPDVVDRV
jgi:hypothetical protein